MKKFFVIVTAAIFMVIGYGMYRVFDADVESVRSAPLLLRTRTEIRFEDLSTFHYSREQFYREETNNQADAG